VKRLLLMAIFVPALSFGSKGDVTPPPKAPPPPTIKSDMKVEPPTEKRVLKLDLKK
jgi:hypothetical protein